jgi:cholesterol oxidase
MVGSGFGGSVAALPAAEKGYRVGVMESGPRWPDERIPKSQWDLAHFVWFPAAELYGVQRIEYLDDVLVLSGAGVGGGSHVYASTMYVPPKQFFDAKEWSGITDWADELAPYFGGVGPRRTGCISCGNCNNGCGHNAKNKVTTNYLYLAEKLGARVHDMHEVFDLVDASVSSDR